MKLPILLAAIIPLASCNPPAADDPPNPKTSFTVKSENSFEETYSRLKSTIKDNPALTIVAELDHSKHAKENAAMDLLPSRVIMFGNPALGTPLMQTNQKIGLDLPQKMLVHQNSSGNVYITYHNPQATALRYNISGQDEVVKKISKALAKLGKIAATKPE